MLKQRHQLFVTLLSLVDAMVATVACCAAWVLRVRLLEGVWPDLSTMNRWSVSVRESLLLLELPLLLMCMWAFGLYRPRRDRTLLAETLQLLKAVFVSLVMLIVVLWALGPRFVGDWLVMDAGSVGSFPVDAPRLQLIALMALLPAMLVPIAIWPRSLFIWICSRVCGCSTGGKICIHVAGPARG